MAKNSKVIYRKERGEKNKNLTKYLPHLAEVDSTVVLK